MKHALPPFRNPRIQAIMVFLILSFPPAVLTAGTSYEISCPAVGCGFHDSIGIGGGVEFEEASGYCARCGRCVSATWKRGSTRKPLLHSFWDALSGRNRQIFRCPGCRGGVVAIASIEEFRHCPKCNRTGIRSRIEALYD